MTPWPDQVRRPADFDGWLASVAGRLLLASRLVVGGRRFRLIETELYYHGPGHPDPFAHRDPVQQTPGRWYFHRSRGAYRGGSFKGVDLSFGDTDSFAGALLRGMIDEDTGEVTDGPSLLVDRLLSATGCRTVAELDAKTDGRPGWDERNPVRLIDVPTENRPLLRTPRVGLSLRTARPDGEHLRYLLRPYRFLTEPRGTKKGKLQMVLPLLKSGEPIERIRDVTGVPLTAVRRYATALAEPIDPVGCLGRELTPADVCRLYGMLEGGKTERG